MEVFLNILPYAVSVITLIVGWIGGLALQANVGFIYTKKSNQVLLEIQISFIIKTLINILIKY